MKTTKQTHTFLIEVITFKPKHKGQRDVNFFNSVWDRRTMKLTGSTPEEAVETLNNSDVVADTWMLMGVYN